MAGILSASFVKLDSELLTCGVLRVGVDDVGVPVLGTLKVDVGTDSGVEIGNSVSAVDEDDRLELEVSDVVFADVVGNPGTTDGVELGVVGINGDEVVDTVDSVVLDVDDVLEVDDEEPELVVFVVVGVLIVLGLGFFFVRLVDIEVDVVEDVDDVVVGVDVGKSAGCVTGVV